MFAKWRKEIDYAWRKLCHWIDYRKDVLMVISQTLLVLVGLGSVWIVYWMTHEQNILTERALALTDSLNRVESRAYVFPASLDTLTLRDGNPAIRLVFLNSGKTPAYEFSMVVKYQHWDTIDYDQDPRLFVYHPGINEKTLAMGQSDPEIVKADPTHWKTNGRYILVFGRTWYLDYFGKRHFTTFAYYLEWARSGFACFPGYDGTDEYEKNQPKK